jgi:Zn finger protein HypA/HybF involved in hydrogenase expression
MKPLPTLTPLAPGITECWCPICAGHVIARAGEDTAPCPVCGTEWEIQNGALIGAA